jgi:hypothetical protein
MKLETIQEHNEKVLRAHAQFNVAVRPSGIACPKCGEELDIDYSVQLLSYPVQYRVLCTNCEYTGSVF